VLAIPKDKHAQLSTAIKKPCPDILKEIYRAKLSNINA